MILFTRHAVGTVVPVRAISPGSPFLRLLLVSYSLTRLCFTDKGRRFGLTCSDCCCQSLYSKYLVLSHFSHIYLQDALWQCHKTTYHFEDTLRYAGSDGFQEPLLLCASLINTIFIPQSQGTVLRLIRQAIAVHAFLPCGIYKTLFAYGNRTRLPCPQSTCSLEP